MIKYIDKKHTLIYKLIYTLKITRLKAIRMLYFAFNKYQEVQCCKLRLNVSRRAQVFCS